MSLKDESIALRNSVKSLLSDYKIKLDYALEEAREQEQILQSNEAATDKSENSVFQSAHDAYMKAQSDIAMFSNRIDLLNNYIFDYIPSNVITINTTVKFELVDYDGKFGKEFTMLLVPKGLGNAKLNLLDINSPIGKNIYKHVAGEIVPYKTLSGTKKVHIKEIY